MTWTAGGLQSARRVTSPPVGDSAWLTMATGVEAAQPQAWEPLCGSRRAELSPSGPGHSALLGPAGAGRRTLTPDSLQRWGPWLVGGMQALPQLRGRVRLKGFMALGVLSRVTSEAGSAACLSLSACDSSKSWALGHRRGPSETLGRVRPGWVGNPGKPLVPLVFLSRVCGWEGAWGLSFLSDVLLRPGEMLLSLP